MWDNSAVTNGGRSVLVQWIGGGTLKITRARVGSGTVAADALPAQTAVTNAVKDVSITAYRKSDDGMQYTVRLTPGTTAYTAKQIGIYGRIGSGAETLIAIYQDSTGIMVPSSTDMPEFVYDFYATVAMATGADIDVSIASELYAKIEDIPTKLSAFQNDAGYVLAEQMKTYGFVVSDTRPELPVGGVWVRPNDSYDTVTVKPVCSGGMYHNGTATTSTNSFDSFSVCYEAANNVKTYGYLGFDVSSMIADASKVVLKYDLGDFVDSASAQTGSKFDIRALGTVPASESAAKAGYLLKSGITCEKNADATGTVTLTGSALTNLKKGVKNGRVYIVFTTNATVGDHFDFGSNDAENNTLTITEDDSWSGCSVYVRKK